MTPHIPHTHQPFWGEQRQHGYGHEPGHVAVDPLLQIMAEFSDSYRDTGDGFLPAYDEVVLSPQRYLRVPPRLAGSRVSAPALPLSRGSLL